MESFPERGGATRSNSDLCIYTPSAYHIPCPFNFLRFTNRHVCMYDHVRTPSEIKHTCVYNVIYIYIYVYVTTLMHTLCV